jgi:hypothetical protein
MKRREFIAGLGSAAAWPLAARAQQPTVPVIGYLNGGGQDDPNAYRAAFRKGLSQQGSSRGETSKAYIAMRRHSTIACPYSLPIWSIAGWT